MMTSPQKKFTLELFLLLLLAALLLAVVYDTTDATRRDGLSLLTAAQQSGWHTSMNWPAAWCSVKIILLAFAFFFALLAMCRLMKVWLPAVADCLILPLICFPLIGVWIGLFYLLRALF